MWLSVRRCNSLPLLIALTLTLALALPLVASSQSFETAFEDGFDSDYNNFSGKTAWVSEYCDDKWATANSNGVWPKSDDGCGDDLIFGCKCEFGVGSGCGLVLKGDSDPYDNVLHLQGFVFESHRYEVTMTNSDDDAMGVVFRYVGPQAFYMVVFSRHMMPKGLDCGSDEVVGARLYRVQGEIAVTLASSEVTYQIGMAHRVRVDAIGSSLSVSFDANGDGQLAADELLFDVEDTTYPSGEVGLFAYENGGCGSDGCGFDDVLVQVYLPGGTDEGGTDEGGTDEGGTDEGGTDLPGTDEGGTTEGGTDLPGTDEGGTTEGGTDSPGTDEGGTDEGGTDEGGTGDGGATDLSGSGSGETTSATTGAEGSTTNQGKGQSSGDPLEFALPPEEPEGCSANPTRSSAPVGLIVLSALLLLVGVRRLR